MTTPLLHQQLKAPMEQLHIDEADGTDSAQLDPREMEIEAQAKPSGVPHVDIVMLGKLEGLTALA